MGFSLRKLFDEAKAQVNPWDNGKTASTVRANYSKPAPAKTVSQPRSTASRVFDQLNPFDSDRTFKNNTPTQNDSIIHQASHNWITDKAGDFVVKPFVLNPSQIVSEGARQSAAQVTGNKAAIDASRGRQIENLKNSLPGAIAQPIYYGAKANTVDLAKQTVADLTGNQEASQNANTAYFQDINKTPIGGLLTPVQQKAASYQVNRDLPQLTEDQRNQMAAYSKSQAGLNPDQNLSSQLLQSGSSALQLTAPTFGIAKTYITPGLGAADYIRGATFADMLKTGVDKVRGNPLEAPQMSGSTPIDYTPKVKLRPNEALTLSDFQDVLTGRVKDVKTINAINKDAYQAAKRTGIDITSGSSADIQTRINKVLEQPQNNERFFKPLNEVGGGKIPVADKLNEVINGKDSVAKQLEDAGLKPKKSSLSKKAGAQDISPNLEASINKHGATYNPSTNEALLAQSDKYVNSKKSNAYSDVSARLDVKGSVKDAQTVSDAIATIKKLDETGTKASLQQAAELHDKLSGELTKAGQTVQASTLLYNRTPQGLYYSALRTLKKAGVEVTPKLQTELTGLLNDVKKTDASSYEGGLARFKFIEHVSKSVPSGTVNKAVQLWKAGLLSGPVTTAGNLMANTLEQTLKRGLEDPIAVGADRIMSVFTGKRSKSLTTRGVASGLGEGATKGVNYFKTGYDPRNPASKFDVRNIHYSDSPLGKAAEAYTQSIFKLMGSQDQPFFYASMRNSLYDQAITAAKNSGLQGAEKTSFIKKFITEPSKKSLELANKEAKYDVFQNETKLGDFASKIKRDSALGDFIIPFSGVPSSIATRIIERTPIGTAHEIIKQMRSGKFDQRAMSQALARGTTGVLMAGVGTALANNKSITLAYPQDSNERKLWEVEGKQPYSVKIGNKWVSLNYFQPAGTLIAAGAEYQQAKNEGSTSQEAWTRAVASAGKALTQQSFLKGVSGTLDAVTDPARSASKFIENTAGSLVPNFIKSPTRGLDSLQRQSNSPLDAVKSGIPGLRQTLTPKVDPYGQDMKRPSSAINSIINPGRPSDIKPADATTQELRRLQDAGVGIMTPTVGKTALGKDTKINDKQITEIEKLALPEIKSTWDSLIADPRYNSLGDEDKMKLLRKASEDTYSAMKQTYAAKNQVGQFSPDYTGKQTKLTANQRSIASGSQSSFSLPGSTKSTSYKDQYDKAVQDLKDNSSTYSFVEKAKKQSEINSLAIKKNYSKDAVDLYGMSKSKAIDLLNTLPEAQANKLRDELVKYGDDLVKNGTYAYNKYKNKYGKITFTKTTKGSKKGKGGKKGKKSALLFNPSFAPGSRNKSLRSILDQARVSSGSTKSAPVRRSSPRVAVKKATIKRGNSV